MRRTTITGLTAIAMSAVTMLAGGFASGAGLGGRPPGAPRLQALAGREVIKIVGTIPGPLHAKVTAKGAFDADGYFFRKKASLIFPKGRLAVRRRLLSTSYRPPNLATCWFKIRQHGTFSVFYATGKYRGLRYGGQFWTRIAGRLKRTGPDQCGSKIAYYRSVTYEIGKIP
ncbi:MAG TPA: hypothetical protein VN695_16495 [Streptosporangiaceae bacterium]|nr:hypothetical protein [Streptosporangiaceae bacterium]